MDVVSVGGVVLLTLTLGMALRRIDFVGWFVAFAAPTCLYFIKRCFCKSGMKRALADALASIADEEEDEDEGGKLCLFNLTDVFLTGAFWRLWRIFQAWSFAISLNEQKVRLKRTGVST